jgi:hypothetical protein
MCCSSVPAIGAGLAANLVPTVNLVNRKNIHISGTTKRPAKQSFVDYERLTNHEKTGAA